MHTFGHHKLHDLLGLLRDKKITQVNAMEIMKKVLDGDTRLPCEISDTFGFTGVVYQSEKLLAIVQDVVKDNEMIVQRYQNRPLEVTLMKLVGIIQEQSSEFGDPVVIKSLILDQIKNQT